MALNFDDPPVLIQLRYGKVVYLFESPKICELKFEIRSRVAMF